MIEPTNTMTATTPTSPAADNVLIGLTHGAEEPESVLIAYLMGVEALRAGKQTAMWLTKEGINIAIDGFAETIDVQGAPDIGELHQEYVNTGGQFFVCPVCAKLRGEQEATWTKNAEVTGAPAVYDFTTSGALVLNY